MFIKLPQFGPNEGMIIDNDVPPADVREMVFTIVLGPNVLVDDTEGYLKCAAHIMAQFGGHNVSPIKKVR
ncbi:MAG: hypothetical protein JRD89_02915 [Deltaproteobacteria bacterium]|nr:hypothetical protein [Deltaproteobacteria bacterium]